MRLTRWNCPRFNLRQPCFQGFKGFKSLLTTFVLICVFFITITPSALANLDDDHFDGNIFALYGGNGSLVPPRVTLAESRRQGRPALLVFFLDDSKDCKKFTTTVSELQRFYGRAADFIPVNVDTLLPDTSYSAEEPGYYYKGYVPQTVLINQGGKSFSIKTDKLPLKPLMMCFVRCLTCCLALNPLSCGDVPLMNLTRS